MDEYLRRHAGDDWIKIYIADFFDQLVEEIKERLARNPNPFIFAITIWDLENVLYRYPGSKRGESFKSRRDPWGKELTYTPPNVTKKQLIEFSGELLQTLQQEGITVDPVWQTPARFKNLVITAFAISRLLKKVRLVDPPEEIKFQLKELEEDVVWAVLTGIFYRRSHPDEPLFVEVGDIVEASQPICILEASKVFNTILAEQRMRILGIVAEDGSLVQAGDILFKVEILEETK